jgi:predicted phosphodiesterase
MILAHLADLHLGYRAYHRLAPGGINARERDVAAAFGLALDQVVALGVDLVLVAGDVFHTVRPSNIAIADAFRQFSRLRAELPRAPVVVIAGNHDSPRAVETGSILRLLAEIPGVHVVDDIARAVHLPELDATVLCLPHNSLVAESTGEGGPVRLEPDPAASTNILMLHGTVTGGTASERLRYVSEYGGAQVETSAIEPARWDYVALGHYHIATELAPNMWYAGGIERTSTNIWEEAGGAKGFLTYDTEARRAIFHPLPGREVVDLPRFSARVSGEAEGPGEGAAGRYLEPAEIDERIRALVEGIPGGRAGKIVRLVLTDLPREVFRALDHRQLREFRATALHFHLDARRPEVRRLVGHGAPTRRLTLEEEVRNFLTQYWQRSSGEIETERLVALAEGDVAEAGGGSVDALLEGGVGG